MLVEGLQASEGAVRYARALARRMGLPLVLLLLLPLDLDPKRDPEPLTRRGKRRVQQWLADGRSDDVPIDWHVRAGDPWSEFCKFAAAMSGGIETVVWASISDRADGRPGWSSGHWAARIREGLQCPVVVAQRRPQSLKGPS